MEQNKKLQKTVSAEEQHFHRIFRRLAIPIALQHLLVSTVNMADVLMISYLGTTAVAGVGLANQVYFLLSLLNYGLYSGMGVFIAQYWGKRDIAHIHRILGLGLSLGIAASVVFSLAAICFPLPVLRCLSADAQALELGVAYLRVVGISYLATSLSNCLGVAMRSVGQPRFALITSIVSLLLNILLNYVLIFGKCGFAPLGVVGAAVGTIIARSIELLLLLVLILRYARFIFASPRIMLDMHRDFIHHYFQIALPVIINESLWGLGMVMYVAAYEKVGTEALAVSQITSNIHNIVEMVAMGIGNAAAVMIGNIIGEGAKEQAFVYARRFLRMTLKLGILTGLLLLGCIPWVLDMVEMGIEVQQMLQRALMVCALLFPIRAVSVVIIVGVLRGGGDTRFAMLAEILNVWLIGVPLAFIGALVWKLPIHWLMLLVAAEEVGKIIVGLQRIYSKRWIKDLTYSP